MGVYHGDTRIATLSLVSRRTVARAVIALPPARYAYSVVEFRTLSTKLVRIDGVILLR